MLLGCSIVSTIGLLLVFWVWMSFGGGAIWVQRFGVDSFVQTIRGAFVQQIEPAKDATRMEEADKLFSVAFEKTSALK
jgi:hypothetical protein